MTKGSNPHHFFQRVADGVIATKRVDEWAFEGKRNGTRAKYGRRILDRNQATLYA